MSPTPPELRKQPWWRRKWVAVGEVIGIGALAVAGLNYMDAHRERRQASADRAAEVKREVRREALILVAEPVDEGERLLLKPMRAGQVIQSQRYVFPRPVLDRVMEVSAAQPQIQAAWVRDGLRKAASEAAEAQGRKAEGDGRLPVGVATTYVEDGEVRTDRALYLVGYRVTSGGLFGGSKVTLQGVALGRRGLGADIQALVDASWGAAPKLL